MQGYTVYRYVGFRVEGLGIMGNQMEKNNRSWVL